MDALRGAPPCPVRVRSAAPCADVDGVLSQLREVAVWLEVDEPARDTARYLLQAEDMVWHSVAFGDPAAGKLTSWLRNRPGFDDDRLLDAVMNRSGGLVTIWSATRREGSGRTSPH
ncbi:MAG TPA: hypothetical protein VIQ30_25985 [Pseudonocardia sp.]